MARPARVPRSRRDFQTLLSNEEAYTNWRRNTDAGCIGTSNQVRAWPWELPDQTARTRFRKLRRRRSTQIGGSFAAKVLGIGSPE